MPFECELCGKYYDADCGVGFKCKGCGNFGTLKRCEEKDKYDDD